MAKGDATERRARQRRAPDGADKAQLASAWAAAGHLPKLDAKLIEKALPGGKAQIGAYEVTRVLGEKGSSPLFMAACASPGRRGRESGL